MYRDHLHPDNKISWRNIARLNICIAKDLADSFGGSKTEYLKRLNQNLRGKISIDKMHSFLKAA